MTLEQDDDESDIINEPPFRSSFSIEIDATRYKWSKRSNSAIKRRKPLKHRCSISLPTLNSTDFPPTSPSPLPFLLLPSPIQRWPPRTASISRRVNKNPISRDTDSLIECSSISPIQLLIYLTTLSLSLVSSWKERDRESIFFEIESIRIARQSISTIIHPFGEAGKKKRNVERFERFRSWKLPIILARAEAAGQFPE